MRHSVVVRHALRFILLGLLLTSAAVVLAATETHTGYLSGPGDEDFYTIHLEEGQTVVAIMRNDDCLDAFDPWLDIHPAGDLDVVLASDDDSADGCGSAYDSRLRYTAASAGEYVIRATTYDTHYESDYGTAEGSYRLTITIGDGGGSDQWFQPGDDRINIDAHAPVSVYCTDGNGVEVYSINNAGKGTSAFTVTAAQIAAAAPGTQIATGNGATLYKLVDGTLQVLATQMDGKGYMFVWNGCPATWANSYIVVNSVPTLTNARVW